MGHDITLRELMILLGGFVIGIVLGITALGSWWDEENVR